MRTDGAGCHAFEDVLAELLARATPTHLTETRTLERAQGCYLAQELLAPMALPPAANSAMDGYAIASKNTTSGVWLHVSERIPAGYRGGPLQPGTAARIFTGADLPQGADTIVIQENAEVDAKGGTGTQQRVRFTRVPGPGEHVRQGGQDLARGQVIVQAGARLNPAHLALLAAVGISELLVFTPLKIALLATGDELVQPGAPLAPGQRYNSTQVLLGGLLKRMGMAVLDLGLVPDTPAEIEAKLVSAAAQADCMLVTGGVSVGEEDHLRALVAKLGSVDIWKVAIKPGKPFAYGRVGNTPFLGLPGNPVSTFVTFVMLARPYLVAMQGAREARNKVYFGESNFHYKAGNRREYLRVRRTATQAGKTHLDMFPAQGSSLLTSVAWADALAEVDINQEVTPGEVLKLYVFEDV